MPQVFIAQKEKNIVAEGKTKIIWNYIEIITHG